MPKIDDDQKLDFTGLQLRNKNLYREFQEIEYARADQKKVLAKTELMWQK